MPVATINRLLERLAELPEFGDAQQTGHRLQQLLDVFRKEREAATGPISEAQWRGILLSALDLVDMRNAHQTIIRNGLGRAIAHGLEDNAA